MWWPLARVISLSAKVQVPHFVGLGCLFGQEDWDLDLDPYVLVGRHSLQPRLCCEQSDRIKESAVFVSVLQAARSILFIYIKHSNTLSMLFRK